MTVAVPLIAWPIVFDSTTYNIKLTISGAPETLPFPASGSLTSGRYYWVTGDGSADTSTDGGVGDLITMLKTALDAHTSSGAGFTVSVSSAGYVTISHASSFQVHWDDAATTFDESIFGFDDAATPSPAGTTTTSASVAKGWWLPGKPVSEDTYDITPIVGRVQVSMSGLTRTANYATTPKASRRQTWELLYKEQCLDEFAPATGVNATWQQAWLQAIGIGYPYRYYSDATSIAGPKLYRTTLSEDPLERMSGPTALRYRLTLSGLRAED